LNNALNELSQQKDNEIKQLKKVITDFEKELNLKDNMLDQRNMILNQQTKMLDQTRNLLDKRNKEMDQVYRSYSLRIGHFITRFAGFFLFWMRRK
jgi:uncharacterized protein (DUF3084 family)